jgi:type IV pilus assembly protein PilM
VVNFFKKLLSKGSNGIGLEIAPERLNIVQLRQQGASYQLETYATAEVPEGVVEEGLIADPPEMAQLIQETLAEHNLTNIKRVATAVPAREGVIRIIPVPKELNDLELREYMNQEAGLYLPFPREEADVDFQKLGEFMDEDGIEKVQVLLVATRKEVTDTYISTFQEAGLGIEILEISSFALLRTIREQLLQLPPEEAVVLTDIQFDSTEIAIVVDGIPQFSRTIPIGTYQVQNALSQAMNLPPSRNTDMLQGMTIPANPTESTGSGTMGGGNSPGTQAIIKVFSELGDELRRSIDFYMNQSEGLEVGQLLLAGPGASIGGLDDFFNQRLSLLSTVVDPVENLSLEVEEETMPQMQRPGLGVVLGLAMREAK